MMLVLIIVSLGKSLIILILVGLVPITKNNPLKIIINDSRFNNWVIGEKIHKLFNYNDEFKKTSLLEIIFQLEIYYSWQIVKEDYKKNLPSLKNFEKLIKEKTIIIVGDSGNF